MNCCDYNCNQGRNCPARRAPAASKTPKPLASWRFNLRGKWITWCIKTPGWIRFGRLIIRWEKA